MALNESKQPLRDPADEPSAAVVIWDGQCNFCRSQVERLSRFDSGERLAFISLHDPRVAERYPSLSYEQMMAQMWVVTPNQQMFGGADAFRFLSRYLPRLWWLAPVMHIPLAMPLWRYLYRVIANRRYRLAGKDCEGGTCQLHAGRPSVAASIKPQGK